MNNIAPISVISANYNNGRYLSQFFNSFISSSLHPKELIFVDDGSADNSVDIAHGFQEKIPYLKIVSLPCNVGFGNALNTGLDIASGDYILRIDPDDYISKDFIKTQYKKINESDIDILGCNLSMFRSADNVVIGTSNIPITHERISNRILAGEHGVIHGTIIAKRVFFEKHRYIQENVPAEDYDIFARMLKDGATFENNPSALVNYRVHPESITSILPLSTIVKTYQIRDAIFGTKTSRLHVQKYYYHLKLYRNALGEKSVVKKTALMFISASLYPSRAFRKLSQKFNKRNS